ncbi:sulfatase atsG [Acrocarpospora pleiomorpha]|uniref:Sulfatase atsG n=1 Tax=Acrocarpospora pleiomorpha TaxID=90975 RepID=A0A5M3Y2U8_9ACTN|nr:sulfatase [Acrocarpospora pleiomorpha]GES26153.1 sulfatase atsG [Acrocarpospora pleiomorpha]
MTPNILLITADDLDATVPGCFGGTANTTPRLDRLAAEGMRFLRAHVPVAVCQPSRSALMTGRRPHRNGAQGFEPVLDEVPVLPDLLRPVGYRFGILGKVSHLAPQERFGWDTVRTEEQLGTGRDPQAYARAAAEFIADAARPWFLLANAHDPHRPFHDSETEHAWWPEETRTDVPPPSKVFDPEEADPPGFLPDLALVRKEFAEYLSSARRCDDVVGAVLDVLDASGQAGNTLVIFLSDHGMPFPFAKANCYVQSTRTPLVIRWPGHIAAGRTEGSHFVSSLDLFPTLCTAAGVDAGPDLDGRCLTSLFTGGRQAGREHMVTVFHETAARERFEMRAIQTAEQLYVWNAWSDGDRSYRAENMFGHTWPAMLKEGTENSEMARRNEFYRTRCPEEFYDLTGDPHALDNTAGTGRHRKERDELRSLLLADLQSHGDPLADAFARFAAERRTT